MGVLTGNYLQLSFFVERFFLTNGVSDVNIVIEFKFIKIKSKNFFRKKSKQII